MDANENLNLSQSRGKSFFRPPWKLSSDRTDQRVERTPENLSEIPQIQPLGSLYSPPSLLPTIENDHSIPTPIRNHDEYEEEMKFVTSGEDRPSVSMDMEEVKNSEWKMPNQSLATTLDIGATPEPTIFQKLVDMDGKTEEIRIRSVREVPEKFRHIFPYRNFNALQSKVILLFSFSRQQGLKSCFGYGF